MLTTSPKEVREKTGEQTWAWWNSLQTSHSPAQCKAGWLVKITKAARQEGRNWDLSPGIMAPTSMLWTTMVHRRMYQWEFFHWWELVVEGLRSRPLPWSCRVTALLPCTLDIAVEVQQVLPEANIFLSAGLDSYQWTVTSQHRQLANVSN